MLGFFACKNAISKPLRVVKAMMGISFLGVLGRPQPDQEAATSQKESISAESVRILSGTYASDCQRPICTRDFLSTNPISMP
jgi:hypothetical protein